jgi:aryl-alcohol dehydrogenase-like predicted oxidoreductase
MDLSIPQPQFFKAPLEINQFHNMPYQPLGRSGLWAPRIGLGTWKYGMPETGDEARVDQRTAMQIFDRAVELGVTFWDTAARYNNASGNSERVIGAWLAANPDQRRNVIIATKLYGGMDGLTPNHCRLTRGNIKASVDASLKRMGTDYIDLLYFHHYDPVTPVEESCSAVDDLVRSDKIRYLGVSNFTIDQLKQHQEMEAVFGNRIRIIAVQNQYDILRKEPAEYLGVLDYVRGQHCDFVAYSPLAEGFLTDRYLDISRVQPGDRIYDQGMLNQLATPDLLAKLRRLGDLAHQWGIELSQLVLAYLLTLPGMGPVIPAATTVRQLESNAKSARIQLSGEQCCLIERIVG